eukprot:m.214701 g.214701  ORF g.214701 m.214701 type:complete len:80 (-) comp17196_c0_seq37:1311-1550(-)
MTRIASLSQSHYTPKHPRQQLRHINVCSNFHGAKTKVHKELMSINLRKHLTSESKKSRPAREARGTNERSQGRLKDRAV